MGTHDPKDIDEEVNSSWKLVSHLENEFCDIPAARELVINVREKIEEFKRDPSAFIGKADTNWPVVRESAPKVPTR